MPAPSIGIFYCLNKNIAGLPFDTQCVVTVFKNAQPFRIEVQDIWSGRTYVAKFSNDTVNGFVEYALKSDLLNLSRTLVSGDGFSDMKDLSILPGIYGVGPGKKNAPENTYGLLEVTTDAVNNWRFLKFTPTNIKSHYLMFYNGYDKTWSEWVHFSSTT